MSSERRKNRQVRNLVSLLGFLLSIIVFAATLTLLNLIPPALDHSLMKPFPTIEAARTEYNLRDLHLPAYFPEYLSWPPYEVFASAGSTPSSILHFGRRNEPSPVPSEPALAIRQSWPGKPLRSRLEPVKAVNESLIEFKNSEALLRTGQCPRVNRACNQVLWREDGREFSVVLQGPVDELLKIARSMAGSVSPAQLPPLR